MKIELKKLEYREQLDYNPPLFSAELYIDGLCCGTCDNKGNGEPTQYWPKDEKGASTISKAEEHYRSLRPQLYKLENSAIRFYHYPSLVGTLENLALEMIRQLQQVKRENERRKTVEKLQTNAVVYSSRNGWIGSYRLAHPIATMLTSQQLRMKLIDTLKNLDDYEWGPGTKVLNSNIPVEIYNAAGLKAKQYEPPGWLEQPKHKTKGKRL